MNAPCSMFLLFVFAGGASAQALPNPSDRSNVIVVQKKWSIDVRNPALEKDPVKAVQELQRAEDERKSTDRENEIRNEKGMPSRPSMRGPAAETGPRGLSVSYIYELKVRNAGEKTIRTLIWEYVFFEPGTERELGRRRFVSKVNIGPGKTRNLVERSVSPPTGAVDATKVDKKPRDQYSERVVIQRIEYADGFAWEKPGSESGRCM